MVMKTVTVAMLSLVVTLAGCMSEKKSEENVSKRLDEKGVREVLAEARKDEYTPPADGKLTHKQIEMYLEVREHEQKIAKVARQRIDEGTEKFKGKEKSFSGFVDGIKSLGSAADFFTADIRAAQELGHNTAEYEWVKSRVVEAAGSVVTGRITEASRAAAKRHAEKLRKKMEATENETERNTYARILETYEKNFSSDDEAEVDESVAYNRALLAEYEDAMATISSELSRFEIREGQAEKQTSDLMRDLDELNKSEDSEQ